MNPFEDEDNAFRVLVNAEGQHSLWPDFMTIPTGWKSVLGPTVRDECISYVEETWTDMRPKSLVERDTHD